jgi:Flp pilus assembly protein TadG
MPGFLTHLSRRFWHRDGGNMMIEFALALPVLSIMLLGMLDLGRYGLDKSAILQGAREGAQFGTLAPNSPNLTATDLTNVNTTAQGASGLTGVTASSSLFCECTSGTSVSCTSTCSGGLKHYITVTTTRAFSSVVGRTGLNFGSMGSWVAPTSVSASVTMILQ